MEEINTVGRRKAAVARIYVTDGSGKITINKKDLASKTWNYLTKNKSQFDGRKSSIYNGSPAFSMFGVSYCKSTGPILKFNK